MREAYSFSVTLLTALAEPKLMSSQLPGLLLLASQRVDTLPSLAMAAVRLLPDWPEAVAVPLSARLLPLTELTDELLDAMLLAEDLLEAVLDATEEATLEATLDETDEAIEDATLLDCPPQPATTSAASFSPLPGPAAACVMHLTFSAGCSV